MAAGPPESECNKVVSENRRFILNQIKRMSMVGQTIGRYRITHQLGAGGMGIVYGAQDTLLGRGVAIKVLHPDVGGRPERVRRFSQEARAASALNHPNIVTGP